MEYVQRKDIVYMTQNITHFVINMIDMLENGYITESINLEYRHFQLKILQIADYTVHDLTESSIERTQDMLIQDYQPQLLLHCKILCAKHFCYEIIYKEFTQKSFEDYVTEEIKKYFVNDHIVFLVKTSADELQVKSLLPSEAPPYVFHTIIAISGCLVLIGFCAFIFNQIPNKCSKIPGFHIVDDGKWMAVMIFGLQFWFVFFIYSVLL